MNGHHALYAPKRAKGLTPEESAFADMERAKGRSWGAIGRMLDRSEHDVRSACDTAYDEGGQR
jgi:hypothetical protein